MIYAGPETLAQLRHRLARMLLANGAFTTAYCMEHETCSFVLRRLSKLIADLTHRHDARADVIRRVRKQFRVGCKK